MTRRLINNSWFILSWAVLLSTAAFADEPAVLNDPLNAWENVKKVLNTAEPSGDALWNLTSNEFKAGSSIRLYSAAHLDIPVINDLDARIGWFESRGIYGTLSIALDRATGQDILRYTHVGWMVGWDSDRPRKQVVTGPVVGVKVSF